jgi:zinc/manganese transport system substrate-binding protein
MAAACRRSAPVVLLIALVGASIPPAAASPQRQNILTVVAAENFWGSLAGQLGGRLVHVTSIVSDPNADPHEYETSSADARAVAGADYVIVNGAGYDSWANRLLSAQPEPGRRVLTVSSFLGKPNGSNPHLWYDPSAVSAVVNRITADYEALEPAARSYFAARHTAVETALAPYRAELSSIRARFHGVAVASTESIFVYLARYLGLRLVSPPAFMEAVAEGVDPPASALATFEHQIQTRAFRVLVYNTQTVTPLTTQLRQQATSAGLAVVGISETLQPPGTTFQRWMLGELGKLARALGARSTQ